MNLELSYHLDLTVLLQLHPEPGQRTQETHVNCLAESASEVAIHRLASSINRTVIFQISHLLE